jgi:hypothetical protein
MLKWSAMLTSLTAKTKLSMMGMAVFGGPALILRPNSPTAFNSSLVILIKALCNLSSSKMLQFQW